MWGIQGLTLREQLQVETGNLLYQRALILVAWAVVFYVAVLVEHPAEPEQSSYASTWRLPQTRWLLRAPGGAYESAPMGAGSDRCETD